MNTNVPAPCPICGRGMIVLTSYNQKWCDCGYKVEHTLKIGQKSVLVDGLVGGDEDFYKLRKGEVNESKN